MDSLFADAAQNRERVLVIFPGALGDLICLVPAIRALRRRHLGASIELMARDGLARFAVGRIGVDRGHSIDRREMALLFSRSTGDLAEAGRFFEAFQNIYSFFASADANFRETLRSVSRAGVSFHPFRPGETGHVAAAYLQSLGEPTDALESRIDLLPDDVSAASQRLNDTGLAQDRFVLLMPGSGSPAKNWPPNRFAELAKRIEPRIRVLFVLGPAEAVPLTGEEFRTVAGMELGELTGIASRATLFVGNDSGTSHLAAASGTPGVVIFGPTDPERWGPLGRVRIIRRQPLDALEVGEVGDAVAQLLG